MLMMERLYTPWRLPYIMNDKPDDCPFCLYIAQPPAKDRENLILLRAEYSYIILNRFPYNNGHLMVLPNAHVDDLISLDAAVQAEMMQLTTHCTRLLGTRLSASGLQHGYQYRQGRRRRHGRPSPHPRRPSLAG